IIKFMPLQKFELIIRYFRTFDYTKLDVRDESDLLKTFQAAEEWSNYIQKVSIELYLLGINLTVDECMVLFTGRSKEITLVKGKPTPEGFKVWVIAQQGFFLQWLWHVKSSPYTAVTVELPILKPYSKKGKLQTEVPLSNTQSVIVHLLKRLSIQTYHVFTDNLFSSLQLFRLLQQLGYGATGTARPNCSITTEMKHIKETGKLPNGTLLVYNEYNVEMNHVDRGDQIRSYTTYQHRFRRGPWQALLWSFLLEVALANSFILQKKTRQPRWKPYSTLQAWKEAIYNAIFNKYGI
ncbi:ac transposable element-derived 4, partial [Fusarium acutatum]